MLKFIRLIVMFGLFAIGGCIFLFNGIRDKIEWEKPHGVLEEITEDELYVGKVVEGEIYELWDEFAYTTEYDTTFGVQTSKERTTDRFFALPLEYSFYSDKIMLVAVSSRNSDQLKIFDRMAMESAQYYENGIEYEDYTTTHFVGRVERLSGEYLGWFKKYTTKALGVSEAEAADYYVPYVIKSYGGAGGVVTIVIGAVLTLVGAAGVLLTIVRRIIKGR